MQGMWVFICVSVICICKTEAMHDSCPICACIILNARNARNIYMYIHKLHKLIMNNYNIEVIEMQVN